MLDTSETRKTREPLGPTGSYRYLAPQSDEREQRTGMNKKVRDIQLAAGVNSPIQLSYRDLKGDPPCRIALMYLAPLSGTG